MPQELDTHAQSPLAQSIGHPLLQNCQPEDDIRARSAEQRRAVRQEKSRPIVADLEPWLRKKLGLISQKTKLAEAIRYTLSRWEGLSRFPANLGLRANEVSIVEDYRASLAKSQHRPDMTHDRTATERDQRLRIFNTAFLYFIDREASWNIAVNQIVRGRLIGDDVWDEPARQQCLIDFRCISAQRNRQGDAPRLRISYLQQGIVKIFRLLY